MPRIPPANSPSPSSRECRAGGVVELNMLFKSVSVIDPDCVRVRIAGLKCGSEVSAV